ncbi:unnamed protein product [Cercopithifilaria johnstoni]|uniref:Potassium channel domain-containing protein n=1 Tax=Cercopithifilaria johnstoni TaxID=2874296 RepID=A0A8J2PXJ8_9BILA|nr:unnamed protein product [Cercopithifilaria johnstoni]
MVLITFLFTPTFAIIVMEAERSRQWNYIDSLYYTFTTSTLIGLGDLTPQPSYFQFFILIPLFLISETLFALAFGFITRIKCTLQEEYSHNSQELAKLSAEVDVTKDSGSAEADIDAEIAELSAREMLMDKKIDRVKLNLFRIIEIQQILKRSL